MPNCSVPVICHASRRCRRTERVAPPPRQSENNGSATSSRPIPDAVIALVDLGGTNAKWCGRKSRDWLSALRLDAHDILAGEPCHVAANLQAQANWLGDLGNCRVALQRFPEPGFFLQ